MKKVSIIVPVYNAQNYLNKCLDSLVNQTLKDIEVILVNDGSTDESYDICMKYAEKYPDKVLLISKENEGQAIARNIAIDKANGEYLMFVDSDDWIDKDMVFKMYDKAISCNADIVWCLMNYVTNGQERLQTISNNDDDIKKYLLNNAGPCNKLIKKNIIVNNNLYFPKLKAYEDIAIVPIWALYAQNIGYLDEGLYYYLMRDGSTMKQVKYSKKMEDIFFSLDYLYKKFNNDLYKSELEWLFIDHLLHAASLRFFKFANYEKNIHRIVNVIGEKFPDWKKNKYYKKQKLKYRLICYLFYKERYWLLKLLLKK